MERTMKEINELMEDIISEDPTVYELSYLFLPELSGGDAEGAVTALRALLYDKLKGIEISNEAPKMIDLAYPMTRNVAGKNKVYHTGYFGWIKFELIPSLIGEVKKISDLNKNILRFLIIKTVRENTMLPKKVYTKTDKKGDTPEEGIALTSEELDKTIEDLVIN